MVITAVVVGEILIFTPSTLKDSHPEHAINPMVMDASLSIEGFHAVNLNAQGQKETIDAKAAELYRKEGYVMLKDVTSKIYSKEDDIIHIQGAQGKYYLDKKDLEFWGDIVVTSENLGYQLKTNYLKYEDQKRLFSTNDPVWLSGPNPKEPSLEVTGKGLIANTQTEEITILENVHAKKHDIKAESIDIESQTADVFFNRNEILFKKNVVVNQNDMNIFSDNFLVEFNRRNKGMDKAKAFDDVKVIQGERVATCKNAFLLNREQKIILTGDPKVVQGEDVVKGKVVIFLLKENKIIFDEALGEVKSLHEEEKK